MSAELIAAMNSLIATNQALLPYVTEFGAIHDDAVQVAADRVAVAADRSYVASVAGATVWLSGAAADGVTDDSAFLATAMAAMQPGRVLDLQGKRYAISANAAYDLPDFTKVRNGTIVLTGVASQLLFSPRGTATALVYTGGAIAAGATALNNVAGLTASDVGKFLFLASDDLIYTAYKKSAYVRIDAVAGTTITLDGPVTETFSTNPAVLLVTPKRGVKFENVRFEGDPAKVQRALVPQYCIDSDFDVQGLNVGHLTVGLYRCIRSTFVYRGGNPGIETDNGLDYGGVIYDGCLMCSGLGWGDALRHVIANGNNNGTDVGTSAVAYGTNGKDSVLDFHPNVKNPFDVRAYCMSVRRDGTFANQPSALMYQGGGMLKALAYCEEYDYSAAGLQLVQNSVDAIDITVIARGAKATATRGLEGLIQKQGGSIAFIRTDVQAYGMTNVNSRISNLDTSGAANGLLIGQIDTLTRGEARQYGDLILCRANHTIERSKQSGHVSGITAGNHGFYAGAVAGGVFNYAIQENCTIFAAATAFGARVALIAIRSSATGVKAYGVGGALTTYAVVGHTFQTGNDHI